MFYPFLEVRTGANAEAISHSRSGNAHVALLDGFLQCSNGLILVGDIVHLLGTTTRSIPFRRCHTIFQPMEAIPCHSSLPLLLVPLPSCCANSFLLYSESALLFWVVWCAVSNGFILGMHPLFNHAYLPVLFAIEKLQCDSLFQNASVRCIPFPFTSPH